MGKARRKERDGDQNSTDTKLYLEESVLERKLPEADLKALVDLPAGLDYNEWLASHTLALFEHVNLVYGTISEFCTPSGCADMTGPANRTYLWFDEKGKKTRVAAPQYIDYVMTFTQKTVSDELIFPTKYANEFPSSFESIARKILRLQFHVIAHLYAAHFREIALLGLHTHLNLTFAHLTALHRRFGLIDEKETDVLRDLEVALRLTDDNNSSSNNSHSNSQSQNQQQQQQQDTNSTTTTTASSSLTAATLTSTTTTTTNETTALEQYNNSSQTQSSSCSSAAAAAMDHHHHPHHHVNSCNTTATSSSSLIDGDAAAPPICTQPEAGTRQTTAAHAVFGGGGGLIGGILGDLSSGEFGDTTRYCTSAVPQHQHQQQQQQQTIASTTDAAATAANNGAGAALYLNFNNNNNNHLQQQQQHLNHHHHHPHAHHHHHHHHGHGHHGHGLALGHGQLQQNSGLIQCNAVGVATNSATGATATNNSTTTTTTA